MPSRRWVQNMPECFSRSIKIYIKRYLDMISVDAVEKKQRMKNLTGIDKLRR